MKDELNNYGINNPDGSETQSYDIRREKYENDNPRSIKENAMEDQKETTRFAETFNDPKSASVEEEKEDDLNNLDTSSSSSTSSASSASSSASASAASASVGGGVGAIAGVVAATVATAVIVAAVFISTLTINLSLVMAEMHKLVFEVQLSGAQEQDFEEPIYAILTGDNDVYREQVIDPEQLTIAFDDLEPGTKYLVTVKNESKVFFEGYYYTSTEPLDKGEIISRMEGTQVFVTVRNASLKATEYYTLVAKDAAGNVVFTKDGVEAFTEYQFTIDQPKNLYFYLTVGGKTYAMDAIELPEYDFEHGVWTWAEDNLSATVTYADKKGGEDLVLIAQVIRKYTEPTCEKDGSIEYTAKATYEGTTYSDKVTLVVDSVGHSYEGTFENGHFTYTCSICGDTYTDDNSN